MTPVDHGDGSVPGPGFYRMEAGRYHADPAPHPSLSSSIAALMLARSPLHAKLAHQRLTPDQAVEDPSRAKELGSVTHKLILGHGADVLIIDATDYRTKDAKQERADAYDGGLLPILRADYETAESIVRAVDRQLGEIDGCEGFRSGTPELVAVAQDPTGAWLRAMFDMLEERPDGSAVIWDVKTGDQPAAPAGLGRRIAGMGYEIQAALYERVLATLRPDLAGRIAFRWIFVENEAPHLLQVAELDATGLEMGRRKVASAIALWNRCLRDDDWPGYPPAIVTAEYPSWAEAAWLNREIADPLLAGLPLDPILGRPVPPRIPRHDPAELLRAG